MGSLAFLKAGSGFSLGWAVMSWGLTGRAEEPPPLPGRAPIETVCVDDNATGYGTFQSHNQKVVSNRHGFFMTHIRSRNEAYTAQRWRLSWSTDGGRSFSTLYEATHATNPPVLETDEEDNLYLVRPDFLDGHAYLYRFLAADQYAQPLVSKIENGSAGKYALIYDRGRRQLYYFAHNNTFHVVGLEGTVRRSCQLLQAGPDAVLQYPLLSLNREGVLFAAWTTQARTHYLYWDIHVMQSRDGGETWQKLDGTPLELPVVADQHGPADRITLEDEYEAHTWLSSFLARNGKLHFIYLAQTQPPREHYVRYDLETAQRDRHLGPEFKGERISLMGLSGFLASSASRPQAPLYCLMNFQGRLGCLVSRDHGETWHDYAVSAETFHPYAVGGCRELTSDGYIIGSFTDRQVDGSSKVYFFKIKAGLE